MFPFRVFTSFKLHSDIWAVNLNFSEGWGGSGGGRMELACEMVYVLSAYPINLSIEVFKFNFFSKAPSSARRFYIFFKLWAVPLVDFI